MTVGWAQRHSGVVLHFFIAFLIVGTYLLVSRRLRWLTTRPWLYGPLYGVLVYFIMNEVVLPLSAVATGHRTLPVIVNGLLIHAFGVGLPSALAVRESLSHG